MLNRLLIAGLIGFSGIATAQPVAPGEDPLASTAEAFRTPLARAIHHTEQGFAYFDQGDPYTAANEFQAALDLRPNHPTLLYYLAKTRYEAGATQEAISLLQRFARLGLIADLEADPTFEDIRSTRAYQEIIQRLKRNARARGAATEGFRLRPDRFIPEGIAYDPISRRFFISSVRQAEIRVWFEGEESVFAATGWEKGWSLMGMRVDPERRALWVTASALPQSRDVATDEVGKAALLRFDLESDRLTGVFEPPAGSGEHLFGDCTVATNGRVFVSDSKQSQIYVLDAGSEALRRFLRGPFATLQGVEFSPDSGWLFAADYSLGLFRIDPQTAEAELLPRPDSAVLYGIDGIRYHAGILYAVQNGTSPPRLLRLDLTPSQTAVRGVDILLSNHADFDQPTAGTVAEGAFFLIANSQWPQFDSEAKLPITGLRPPIILRTAL